MENHQGFLGTSNMSQGIALGKQLGFCRHSPPWALCGLNGSGFARSGGILGIALLFGVLGRGPSFATGSQKVTPRL